jgi:hypothetical protein
VVWFVLVGWWLGAVWVVVSWSLPPALPLFDTVALCWRSAAVLDDARPAGPAGCAAGRGCPLGLFFSLQS